MQFLVLKQCVKQAGRWILANTIGFALLGAVVALVLYSPITEAVGDAIVVSEVATYFIAGAILSIVAISQWVAVRAWTPKATWWLPASIVSMTLGMAALFAMILSLTPESESSTISATSGWPLTGLVIGWVVCWSMVGFGTGSMLAYLLKEDRRLRSNTR
jgi:hypothetical protein